MTDRVVVPKGHRVCTYGLGADPHVQRSERGIVVAHFGFGGDDPEEVFDIVQWVSAELRDTTSRPPIALVEESTSLNKLFEVAPPATLTIKSAILWTVRRDGLEAVIQDATLVRRLLSELERLPVERQWLVADPEWRDAAEFQDALRAMRIGLLQSSGERAVLAEVDRPDGLRVCGLVGQKLVPAEPGEPRPLLRSPRLTRRILEVRTPPGPDASFYEELLARRFPLVFLVDVAGRSPRMVTFPGMEGPHLPVFADLRSAERTATETGLTACGIGALGTRELLRWARADRFGVALGAFRDEGRVRYVRLDLSCIGPLGDASSPRPP